MGGVAKRRFGLGIGGLCLLLTRTTNTVLSISSQGFEEGEGLAGYCRTFHGNIRRSRYHEGPQGLEDEEHQHLSVV